MTLSWKLYAAIAILLAIGGAYVKGRYDGSALCGAKQIVAQAKHDKKIRALDNKIESSAPGDNDKSAAIAFLRAHTRK